MKRTLLAVLLAAAVAAPACKKSPPPAPAPTSVARVYAVKGAAYVVRGGTRSDATPGLSLERTDRLQVGPASLLLLEVLANHQVVRLDEELELTVSELALLAAPPAGSDLEQQLDVLLGANERSEFSNRTAGWVVAQEAARVPVAMAEADAVGGSAEPEAEVAARPTAPRAQPGAAPAPAPAAVEPTSADDDPRPKKAKVDRVVPGTQLPAQDKAKPEAPREEPPPPPPAPTASPPASAVPARPVVSGEGTALLADEELRQCLEAHLESYGTAVKARYAGKLTLKYRLKDGALRTRMPDGLPLPKCASEWLEAHREQLAPQETWKDLPVLVK